MNAAELVREGAAALASAGAGEGQHEARLLYLAAAHLTLSDYLLSQNEPVPAQTEQLYRAWIERRVRQEPLQYITGEAPFFGRMFCVAPGVLIPRFDTETLVDVLLRELKEGMRVLDLCTGSGCILLTLLLDGPGRLQGTGGDISPCALETAHRNLLRYEEEIAGKGSAASFVRGDLFDAADGTYDIICANPPYIETEEIGTLDGEVRDHEPRTALDGGPDGLHFYREICRRAKDCLSDGGTAAFEIGSTQADDVRRLMEEAGLSDVRVVRDLSGRDRVVTGRKAY